MKKNSLFTILLVMFCGFYVFAQNLPDGYPQTERSKTKLNTSWKFYLGNPDAEFFKADYDDSDWEEVSIPHTLKLTSINLDGLLDDKYQLTFHREVGWYRKAITVG
ncbi:MAG: hypothetical protein MI740_05745, partial [Halanaerobiales bacterium]|nr:hypothetical protein [Halanaerobiales bacterium]